MLKRGFDLAVALLALMLCTPLLLALAVTVRIVLGAPVLFRQQRPGRFAQPFTLIKFRSMKDACDAVGQPLPDAARLSRLGRWLRATSLDELPELWNVVKGEMSLVGPRPLLMEYLPRYNARQARRHEVRPGLTGWAQIHGRNEQSWRARFELDVWYVEHRNFLLDLKILARSVGLVLMRSGIQHDQHASMPLFTESESAGHGD